MPAFRSRAEEQPTGPGLISVGDTLFGDALARVLERRMRVGDRWTAARLARTIGGVDPTLVRRWLRNERVPSLASGYVARIADAVAATRDEVAQLEAAQIASLKVLRTRGGGRAVELTRELLRFQPVAAGGGPARDPPAWIPGALDGIEETLAAAAAVLESAAPDPPSPNATILVISRSSMAPYRDRAALQRRGHEATRTALRNGWNVDQLWQLDHERSDVFPFIRSVIGLLGMRGAYTLRAFTRPAPQAAPEGLLLVPGVGALITLATRHSRFADAGIFLREPEQVELLKLHFERLREHTRPVAETYPAEEWGRFVEAVSEVYGWSGGVCWYCGDRVPNPLRPLEHLRSVLDGGAGEWPIAAGDRDEAERRRFGERVARAPHQYVFRKRAIRRLLAGDGEALPVERRAGTVRQLLELLEAHPRFEVGLLEDVDATDMQPECWEVRGDHSVILAYQGAQAERSGVLIREPAVVTAYGDTFGELWTSIQPRNREKPAVIGWLRDQLGGLG